MDASAIVILVTGGLTIIGTVVATAWKLGADIGEITAKLDTVMTNHLPHIERRLEAVEDRLPARRHE